MTTQDLRVRVDILGAKSTPYIPANSVHRIAYFQRLPWLVWNQALATSPKLTNRPEESADCRPLFFDTTQGDTLCNGYFRSTVI